MINCNFTNESSDETSECSYFDRYMYICNVFLLKSVEMLSGIFYIIIVHRKLVLNRQDSMMASTHLSLVGDPDRLAVSTDWVHIIRSILCVLYVLCEVKRLT